MAEKVSDNSDPDKFSDAIFHYTNADGLLGILSNGEIWSTGYFTTNDASELVAGKGILTEIFRERTYQLLHENNKSVGVLREHGVSIFDEAGRFENMLFDSTMRTLHIFITCFCRPNSEIDFQDGLLSQWRGYGGSNGYALHFSRSKLDEWTQGVRRISTKYSCSFDNVYYDLNNPYKDKVLEHKDLYLKTYTNYLDIRAEQEQDLRKANELIDANPQILWPDLKSMKVMLERFVMYLLHTKNSHFSEEREYRMSVVLTGQLDDVEFFNKNGVLVPYIKSSRISESLLDCIEGIIVGPGPHQDIRHQSVSYLLTSLGLKKKVRLSKIPYNYT